MGRGYHVGLMALDDLRHVFAPLQVVGGEGNGRRVNSAVDTTVLGVGKLDSVVKAGVVPVKRLVALEADVDLGQVVASNQQHFL